MFVDVSVCVTGVNLRWDGLFGFLRVGFLV